MRSRTSADNRTFLVGPVHHMAGALRHRDLDASLILWLIAGP
ncbi:hypothetical protein [Streptomyces longisporoflavus]|nr:hypothetical protein [Streptomyces longisporoflavus]